MSRAETIRTQLESIGVPAEKAGPLALTLDRQIGQLFGTSETTQTIELVDNCPRITITGAVKSDESPALTRRARARALTRRARGGSVK